MRRALRGALALAALLAGAGAGFAGAQALIARNGPAAPLRNGWRTEEAPRPGGLFGAALARARRAADDPASLPAGDLLVFDCTRDEDGRGLTGASRYVIRFAPGALPPVDAFWALAVLDGRDELSADGGRASFTSRAPDARREPDGAMDIIVQSTPPDDPTANWLFAPPGPFRIVLRAFAPRPAMRDGWRPPAVVRNDSSA